MKKLTKTLTPLLLAGITLSLMCGCENGTAKDKNNSVSGGSSATQSTASDKSDTSNKDESKPDDTSSKDESKTDDISSKSDSKPDDTSSKDDSKPDDTSSKDDSKPDEASDPDYEKMMEVVDKIKTAPDRTIFNDMENTIILFGKPDVDFTGSNHPFIQYDFGKYTLQILWSSDTDSNKIIVSSWNSKTEKVLFAFEIDSSNGEISYLATKE